LGADCPNSSAALIREGKASLWRHAVTVRVPWLELEAPEAMQVNLHGEPISGTRLRFEVLPGALRVCLPVHGPDTRVRT